MCWITYGKSFIEPRYAETDMDVYKIVRLRRKWFGRMVFEAPFCNFGFEYKPNKVYYQEIEGVLKRITEEGNFLYQEIGIGLHCFVSDKAAIRYLDSFWNYDLALVKAVIPGGTKYFINEHGEIVTERLKILI